MENFDMNSEEMQRVMRLEALEHDFYNLEQITDKWGFLRQIYMELLPWILERARIDVVTPIIPYPVDWSRYFSPIEQVAWGSIRGHYMALYPQFPVFNFFIDFANPHLRIGLELDGKAFHDPEKDKIRDTLLWRHGWRIFRVTGKEANTNFRHLEDVEQEIREDDSGDLSYQEGYVHQDIRHWMMNTADGVIYAIKQVYFIQNEKNKYYGLCCDSLQEHRLVDFPLFLEDSDERFSEFD
jgi:very-short-patch-repair endonuclease